MEKIRSGVRFVLRWFMLTFLVAIFWPGLLVKWAFGEEYGPTHSSFALAFVVGWVGFAIYQIVF